MFEQNFLLDLRVSVLSVCDRKRRVEESAASDMARMNQGIIGSQADRENIAQNKEVEQYIYEKARKEKKGEREEKSERDEQMGRHRQTRIYKRHRNMYFIRV